MKAEVLWYDSKGMKERGRKYLEINFQNFCTFSFFSSQVMCFYYYHGPQCVTVGFWGIAHRYSHFRKTIPSVIGGGWDFLLICLVGWFIDWLGFCFLKGCNNPSKSSRKNTLNHRIIQVGRSPCVTLFSKEGQLNSIVWVHFWSNFGYYQVWSFYLISGHPF